MSDFLCLFWSCMSRNSSTYKIFHTSCYLTLYILENTTYKHTRNLTLNRLYRKYFSCTLTTKTKDCHLKMWLAKWLFPFRKWVQKLVRVNHYCKWIFVASFSYYWSLFYMELKIRSTVSVYYSNGYSYLYNLKMGS